MYNIDIDVVVKENKNYQEGNIVASYNFSLYQVDENGELTSRIDHISSHYIYVSGFDENGKVIVSSWENKYYYDDSDAKWVYTISLNYKK